MNELETERHRTSLRAMTTVDQYVRAASRATKLTILIGTPEHGFANAVFNCEYSTISGFAIWLQERGVFIPADICAELKIEVRNA